MEQTTKKTAHQDETHLKEEALEILDDALLETVTGGNDYCSACGMVGSLPPETQA